MGSLLQMISSRYDEYDRGELSTRVDMVEIQKELITLVRAPFEREADREYVYSDSLTATYTADGRPFEGPENASSGLQIFTLHVRFSWVPPFVLLDWKRTENRTDWRTVDEGELPPRLTEIGDQIKRFLEANGLQVLSGPVLDEILPGRYSELDDSLLTVREALFSAID